MLGPPLIALISCGSDRPDAARVSHIDPAARADDGAWVPRNGGRVLFRSRFPDFEGEFVNHCHILLHEDNGMMQRVTVVGNPADSNYEPRGAVISPGASQDDVNAIYGKPSLADSWQQSLLFVDGNDSGQIYPGDGFVVDAPIPPTE